MFPQHEHGFRGDEPARPATHTSWLSNENVRVTEQPYGSIVGGGGGLSGRQPFAASSSVYHALATDTVPEVSRDPRPTATVSHYASKNQLNLTGRSAGNNYWVKPPMMVDVGPYSTSRVLRGECGPGVVVERRPPAEPGLLDTADGADDADERSFASHYASNPQGENYRATWKRTREQAEREKPGRALGLPSPVYLTPQRPDSEATNETGQTGA